MTIKLRSVTTNSASGHGRGQLLDDGHARDVSRGRRRWLGAATGATVVAGLPLGARAEAGWPTRPVRVIVPFPPGGATDITARLLAERLAPRLGQPVVIENKGGASGILGTDMTAKAPPDGYTIAVSLSTSFLINQFLYSKLPYDPQRDLVLLSLLATAPVTLVVRPGLAVRTVPELLDHLRANKGKVSYGSWGAGSYAHLGGAYLSKILDAGMSHVPYKGEAAMLQDLVGGQIDLAFASAVGARPYLGPGKLTVVGVTGDQRMQVLPDVPTLAEQGLKDDAFRVVGWVALGGPAKLPPAIVERLAKETEAVFADADVRQRISDMGFVPVAAGPAEFRAIYQRDLPIWKELVAVSGAKLD